MQETEKEGFAGGTVEMRDEVHDNFQDIMRLNKREKNIEN